MSSIKKVHRLRYEWQNPDAHKLQSVRDELEKLEGQSWAKVAIDVILMKRRAKSPEFIASILYLIDTRQCSAQQLQAILCIHGGHMYRFLGRSGVEWSAQTSHIKSRLEDFGLSKVLNYYYAPLLGKVLTRGKVKDISDDITTFGNIEHITDTRPLPIPRPPKLHSTRRGRKPKAYTWTEEELAKEEMSDV